MASPQLRSGRADRKTTNRFFESIKDLKKAHHKLFSGEVHAAISRRYVGTSTFGLVTCSVRVLAEGQGEVRLRPYIRRGLAALLDQFDDHLPYEVTLTANVILKRPVLGRGGRKKPTYMYSVYYGQTFDSEGSSETQKTALTRAYYMKDLGDVSRFPEVLDTEEILNQFELLFDDSESSVHSLINYVVLFRRRISRPYQKSSKRVRSQKTYSLAI